MPLAKGDAGAAWPALGTLTSPPVSSRLPGPRRGLPELAARARAVGVPGVGSGRLASPGTCAGLGGGLFQSSLAPSSPRAPTSPTPRALEVRGDGFSVGYRGDVLGGWAAGEGRGSPPEALAMGSLRASQGGLIRGPRSVVPAPCEAGDVARPERRVGVVSVRACRGPGGARPRMAFGTGSSPRACAPRQGPAACPRRRVFCSSSPRLHPRPCLRRGTLASTS